MCVTHLLTPVESEYADGKEGLPSLPSVVRNNEERMRLLNHIRKLNFLHGIHELDSSLQDWPDFDTIFRECLEAEAALPIAKHLRGALRKPLPFYPHDGEFDAAVRALSIPGLPVHLKGHKGWRKRVRTYISAMETHPGLKDVLYRFARPCHHYAQLVPTKRTLPIAA